MAPALFELDKRLVPFLNPADRQGFFVEAGANDGLTQSNTYVLERDFGWRGLLVEPIPWLAELASRHRRSRVEQFALGSFDTEGHSVTLADEDLVSSLVHPPEEHTREVVVELIPLSSLLRRHGVRVVDFLSLDVEGYESEALRGIDFDQHHISNLLIETKSVATLPLPWHLYREPVPLTHHDYLFQAVATRIE